jgi:hypothetical protein
MSGARPSDPALVASDGTASRFHPEGFDPSRDNRPAPQFYEQAEGMDTLVWRLCEYRKDECDRCPPYFDDREHGAYKPGCRALVEESVAIVLATTASGMSAGTAETQSGSGPQDRQPDGDSRDAQNLTASSGNKAMAKAQALEVGKRMEHEE